ncbi:MAG: hypothetical protein R3277_02170 [Brumimicrobium sp.]|nr:hypothetical protein [Brumimicrobium sp.]
MLVNKFYSLIVILFLLGELFSQENNVKNSVLKDSLIHVIADGQKGFYHDYILFIPKGTVLNKKTYLLVEPNNTGRVSDSIEVHQNHAIHLASKSSVGNNISTELKIPLLVPVFPRPASKPDTYTHALDRDVMKEESVDLKRLDLQLIAMINDSKVLLKSMKIDVEDKVFMNGFSASGTFTNRFSFIHPELIQALAIGGFNGKLMLPVSDLGKVEMNYPLGLNDFEKLFGKKFEMELYREVHQFIYMGKLDDNDAVRFSDAYSKRERRIINTNLGDSVQDRFLVCQDFYLNSDLNVVFKSYEHVGHWTTSSINLEIIKFFYKHLKSLPD